MKKVLIVKPDYKHLPLGLAYVMASMRDHGIPYEYVDTVFDKTQWSRKLESDEYMVVATGGLCGDITSISQIVRTAKSVNPSVATLVGGSISHDCPSQLLMDMMPLDYMVIGECEASMPRLLKAIAEGAVSPDQLSEINGIAFRNGSEAIRTAPSKPVSLSRDRYFPVWDDITNIQYYIDLVRVPGLPDFTGLPVLTGRGCAGKCTFCSPTLGSFRTRPVDEVIEELRLHHESGYDFDGFLFLNEMFYPSLAKIIEFSEAYKASDIGRPWQCSMRVDMPLEALEVMKDAGCVIVGVGYESGNDDILKMMRKKTSTEQARRFMRKAKEIGLYVYATFMFGSEGESEHEIAQTMDLLIEEKTYGGGAFVTIYPGTQIYNNAWEKGLFTDKVHHLETLDFFNSVVDGNILKDEYVNISNIPDKLELNTVSLKHYSRYRGSIHKHFNVQNVDLDNLHGNCPTCGGDIRLRCYANSIFSDNISCPACKHPVFLDYYHHAPFSEYRDLLQDMVKDKERIVVIGQGVNSLGFLTTDIFRKDPSQIAAVVDQEPMHTGDRFLVHTVLSREEFSSAVKDGSLQPDCIIIGDVNSLQATAQYLIDLELQVPIAPIIPLQWPEFVRDVKAKATQPWDTVRLHLPSPDQHIQCKDLYEKVADHLLQSHGHGLCCGIAPAGAFALNLATYLEEKGIVVPFLLDNYLEESELGGKPVFRPSQIDRLPDCDLLLVGTPNCRAQEIIAESIGNVFGNDVKGKITLLADIYLDQYVSDVQQCAKLLCLE